MTWPMRSETCRPISPAGVLQAAGKDMRNDVNRLLKYKDETAGAIMTTEYLQFLDSISVDEAIESVRCIGRQAETIYTIFVRSADRRFVGTVDLDDLIFARKDQKLSEVMNKNAVSCRADTDQEEAAGMFKRYNLNALAVVNEDNCLIGIITIDDAIDVMEQEASEDIAKMNAVAPMDQPYLKTPIAKMANKCIPWIVILLVLGTFSSLILSSFQNTLAKYSVLAAFVPVLMDTAGNAGSQTCSIVVRSLGLKEYAARDYLKVLWREMLNSLIVASIVGLFCLLWIAVEQYTGIVTNPILYSAGQAETLWNGLCWNLPFFLETFKVSAIVSATIFFAIIVSKFVGLSLPVMAAALKKDPAFMSQPLLATVMDIVSLLIYFGIAIAVIPSIA